MKDKTEIVSNWLPRYTGLPLESFGEHILLTNFGGYLHSFARMTGATVVGLDRPMPSATADGITMINFGMGSANAATVMDLLSALPPKAVLFLGKCGGLKRKNQLGDLILPIAAIRGEGTSNDYMPAEVPALPAFALQRERRLRRALERLLHFIVQSWRRPREDSPDHSLDDLAAGERRLPIRHGARSRSAEPASRSERGDGDAPTGSRRRDARTRRPRRGG